MRQALSTICVAAAFVASVLSAPAQTAPFSFSGARQDYTNFRGAFAVADFNGDGYPDIAAPTQTAVVAIFLNDGHGHFTQAATIPGAPASYVIAADFNHDGFMDVAYSGLYNQVGILLGAGDGSFRTQVQYNGGAGGDLRTLDANGDGKLDLLVGGYSLSLFLGNGDGTLQTPPTTIKYGSPFAIGDFNKDGFPDIAAYSSPNGIAILINNGQGQFSPAGSFTSPSGTPSGMAAGDLNGDGAADLVAVTNANSTGSLLVYKNNGTGTLSFFSATALNLASDNVVLQDVNGDGNLDVLYSKTTNAQWPPDTNLAVRLGNGDATFGAETKYATIGADERIVLADLRRTGHNDLLTGNYSGASVLPNEGNNTFYDGAFVHFPQALQGVASADFNNDGIPDLAVGIRLTAAGGSSTTLTNSQLAGALIFLGTGNKSSPFKIGKRLFVPPDVLGIAAGDFNGDGRADLAFATGTGITIFLGNGDGTFHPFANYTCTCRGVVTGDFNGDGKLDLAVPGVLVLLGNGDGTFGPPTLAFPTGGSYVGVGDFNHDGKPDLVASLKNGGFQIALNSGAGTFTPQARLGNYYTNGGIVADLNNDGLVDFVQLTSYDAYVWMNNGSVLKEGYSFYAPFQPYDTATFGDFNGDGIPDLVFPGLTLQIFAGNGDGTFQPPFLIGAADYSNTVFAGTIPLSSGTVPDLVAVGRNGGLSVLIDNNK